MKFTKVSSSTNHLLAPKVIEKHPIVFGCVGYWLPNVMKISFLTPYIRGTISLASKGKKLVGKLFKKNMTSNTLLLKIFKIKQLFNYLNFIY